MIKKISSLLIIVMMVFCLTCCVKNQNNSIKYDDEGNIALTFDNQEELNSYIEDIKEKNKYNRYINGFKKSNGAIDDSSTMTDPTSEDNSYSQTNTQVKGIDEGDIVKVDNKYIYKLTLNGLVIVEVDNGNTKIVSKVDFDKYVPYELYIYNNKLITIGGIYDSYVNVGKNTLNVDYCNCFRVVKTDIRVYDLKEITNPELVRQMVVEGNYETSRIVDNRLIYMVNFYCYYNEDINVPKYYDSLMNENNFVELPASKVFYFENCCEFNYLVIGDINLDTPSLGEIKAYLGIYGTIYVSQNNIYIVSIDYGRYEQLYRKYLSLDNKNEIYAYAQIYSRIIRISINDLDCKAKGLVEGAINDRYWMDEYNGFFRIATTGYKGIQTNENWESTTSNYVSIFDLDLKMISQIKDIAIDETIYSARFDKEKGYLVTFKRIDPLFNIDLSDPYNPTISKGLKEDGVSYYLHNIEGTPYVIGLGYDTYVNEWGSTVSKGIKVSLYDNSTGEAVNVGNYYIGQSYGSADAIYNPKAILYDKDLNIFGFSAIAYNYNQINGSSLESQAFYVFGFKDGKLELRAKLTNIENPNVENWYDYYDMNHSFISRGVRIGNYLYTISDQYVTSYSLDDFTMIQKLQINNFTKAKELFK